MFSKAPLILMVFGLLFLSACGTASSGTTPNINSGNATIRLGMGKFLDTSATLKAGQSVTFDDSAGSVHNLVTGANATFAQEAGAPSQFTSSGIMFNAGQVTTIVFPTAGTYMITCTFHPNMEATITVTS